MKKLRSFLWIFCCCQQLAIAQISPDTTDAGARGFYRLVDMDNAQSYLAITDGLGNLEPLWMEARLSPNYYLSRKGQPWLLTLNPQVTIRMRQRESFPIRPPSYRIVLKYARSIGEFRLESSKNFFFDDAYWYVALAHHSNGQADSLFLDGEINLETGNFATNYIEAGVSSYKYGKLKGIDVIQQLKINVEYHPGWPIEFYTPEMEDLYGFFRAHLTYTIGGTGNLGREGEDADWLERSRLTLRGGWIFGNLFDAAILDVEERAILDATIYHYPNWFAQVNFFIRYYYGQDYYNNWFLENRHFVYFGISTNTVDLPGTINYLRRKR